MRVQEDNLPAEQLLHNDQDHIVAWYARKSQSVRS